LTFAVAGRARFLSHLETVDTLLGALRRAGYQIALSKGMKPRPVISLALPRAVGVRTLADLGSRLALTRQEAAEVLVLAADPCFSSFMTTLPFAGGRRPGFSVVDLGQRVRLGRGLA